MIDNEAVTLLEPHRSAAVAVDVDERGRLVLSFAGDEHLIHPLWLRDRSTAPGHVDASNRQRLYEPTDIEADLRVSRAQLSAGGTVIDVRFSDGETATFHHDELVEAPASATSVVTTPEPWTSQHFELPTISWSDVESVDAVHAVLLAFHRWGCFRITGTPAEAGALRAVAGRFGRISATNFGELFDVRSVVDPEDLAYTPVGLAAHTDQPYRRPTPGLQFLHTIENSATGGESTVVDGLAAVDWLRSEHRECFDALTFVVAEWRYDIGSDVVIAHAPIIELGHHGELRQIRFSPRLDFAPALDPDLLDRWYEGRRLLAGWFDDPGHRIQFKMDAGDVMVVDNHRVLHGRRPYDAAIGHRHLQGCYIDHDGPATMLRLLDRRAASPNDGNPR